MSTKEEQNKAVEYLKDSVEPGDTIYTVLRHVSQSGMTRWIDLYVIKNNEPLYLTFNAAKLTGSFCRRRNALKVGGCGMDMGFAVVYDLAHVLFDDGYKLNHRWLG